MSTNTSNKTNIPQEVEPGRHYSFRTDVRVNGWSWVAVLTSFVGEVFLLPRGSEWPIALRAGIALVPILASLLWTRSVIQWMRGMDELQRRITLEAAAFATVITLFIVATSHLLAVAGVLPFRFPATAGFAIIWMVVCFYLAGRARFSRRYQ
jgi:hypothetical protein